MTSTSITPTTPTTPAVPTAPIAVVGATGHQGGAVARALLDQGAPVRALTRDPASPAATALAARGAELVTGSPAEPAALDALFTGASAAFAMTTMAGPDGTAGEIATGTAIADAAARAALPHLVFSSVGGAGIDHFESKRRVEERIAERGLPATILRPVYFMENLLGGSARVEDGEVVVRQPLPADVPLQMIAVADIGRVAAAVLLGAEVPGGAIEIAGDERTGAQIAAAFGAAAGLPARYEELPLESLAGMGDAAAMFAWFRELPAYRADMTGTRALDPALLDLPAWIAESDWSARA